VPIDHAKLPEIRQLIHGNLEIAAGGSGETVRSRRRKLGSYSEYVSLLRRTLASIRENSLSPGRRAPIEGVTTLSTGYDSAAVSCLAREQGIEVCFTTKPAESPKERKLEDGTALAAALGYEPKLLTRPDGSAESDRYEPYFLAGTFDGSELIFETLARFASARDGGAMAWTGYHGDKVWDVHVEEKYRKDDILRGDTSGLNLAEVRLESGFVNVAVPFLYARNIEQLARVGSSDEMKPWRVYNGYDRPIPRRIVESAGVARDLFGWGKRVVMRYDDLPNNRRLRAEFLEFLSEKAPLGPWQATAQEWLSRADYLVERMRGSARFGRVVPDFKVGFKRRFIPAHADLQQLMFKWAVERLTSRYRGIVCRPLPSF
jgi:hypothetical protein